MTIFLKHQHQTEEMDISEFLIVVGTNDKIIKKILKIFFFIGIYQLAYLLRHLNFT